MAKVTVKGTKVYRDGTLVAQIYGYREVSRSFGAVGGYGVNNVQGTTLTPSEHLYYPNRPFAYFKDAADWCRATFSK